ncbi:hypothetical protein HMSSN036_42990 [Paenibacillus macerans]|nr:hypothetical protein HMSSN036_42990 [Paenibacillus macerans]
MLRVAFPVNVVSEQANCEIQFGVIKRPTSRNNRIEFARDEICAHHYIDLSQPDYGVALLNDSKYGHSVDGNVIDLNLLRTPGYPDRRPTGRNTSLRMPCTRMRRSHRGRSLPQRLRTERSADGGGAGDGGGRGRMLGRAVSGPAVEMPATPVAGPSASTPIRPSASTTARSWRARRQDHWRARRQDRWRADGKIVGGHDGKIVGAHGDKINGELVRLRQFVQIDHPNVMVEAVKKAEDSDHLIVRLYETAGAGARAGLAFGFECSAIEEADLLENPLRLLAEGESRINLQFTPFEIKTIRVRL